MYPSNDSVRKDIALAFTSQMKDVGVDVKLEGLTFDVIEKRQDKGATEFGYGTPYDPDIELYGLFHSKFATPTRTRSRTTRARASPRSTRRWTPSARSSTRATRKQRLRRSSRRSWRRTRAGCGSCACATSRSISKRVKGVDPQVEPHAHGFSRGTSWNLEDWSLEPKS